jgi:hypothetical protein
VLIAGFGRLGLYSAVDASSYAFVAYREQSWVLQDHIFRDNGICGMDSNFDNALDGLRGTIPNFDVSSFASKDTVLLKHNMFRRVLFLVKMFKIWKLSLT